MPFLYDLLLKAIRPIVNKWPLPRIEEGGIYVHAASLGEVNAISPFIRLIKQRHPNMPIFLSIFTETGYRRAHDLFDGDIAIGRFPYDIKDKIDEFFRKGNFRALLIVETELWPNLILTAKKYGVPIFLVNARLSPRTLRRYRVLKSKFSSLLSLFSLILAQSETDRRRYLYLGAPPERVRVTGSLKFDLMNEEVEPPENFPSGNRRLVVFGSVRPKEEELILKAAVSLLRKNPKAHFVIAPRHIDRVQAIRKFLDSRGIPYSLRTSGEIRGRIMILDTLGELRNFYGVADVAFVGGTLAPYGGHNLVEPAILGVPVIFGPHYFNTPDAARGLLKSGGALLVHNGEELEETILTLLREENLRQKIGERARKYVLSRRGVSEKIYREILPYITSK